MRVEKIRFKNLASLEGEWEIDLTDPVFERSGIFAITGATGAGKTTIFDAIRLALFRRTNRLDGFAGTNEIMTHGTGECFSKLQFTLHGRRYVAFWSQSRARGKPDGNLQPDRHTLEQMLPDGTLQMISEQRKQTARTIVELLKMDFDHFSRAMLLPQGEFAIFLKTPAAERSEILEQITGSAIYKQISAEAFLKYRTVQEKFDLASAGLESIELLKPEEITSLEQQRALQSAEAVRCSSLAAALEHVSELENRLAATRAELQTINQQEMEAEPEIEAAGAVLAEAASRTAAARQERENLRPAITTARTLDNELRRIENELEKNAEQIQQESDALSSAQKELKKLNAERKEAEELEQAIRKELDDHPEDAALPEHFTAWNLKLDDFATLRKQAAAASRTAEERQAILAQRQRECESPKAEQERLRLESEALQKKQQQLDRESVEISGSFAGARDEFRLSLTLQTERLRELIEAAGKLSTAGSRLVRLESDRNQSQERIKQERLELEQLEAELRELEPLFRNPDFAAERIHLNDGEPCPLCGSLHHPYADKDKPEEILRKQNRYRTVSEQVKSIQLRLAADKAEFLRLEKQLSEESAALKEEHARLDEKLPPEWNLVSRADNLLKSLREKQIDHQKRLERWERIDQEFRQLLTARERLEAAIRQAKQHEQDSIHNVDLAALSLEESRKREEEFRTRVATVEKELVTLFAPFRCPLSEAQNILAGRLKRYQERSSAIKRAEENQSRLAHEIELRTGFLQKQQTHLESLHHIQAELVELLSRQRAERGQLLGGRPADEVEKSLEQALGTAVTQEKNAGEQLQNLIQSQAVRTARRESETRHLAELESELARYEVEDHRSHEERAAEAEELREQARRLNEECGAIAEKLKHDAAERGRRRIAEEKLEKMRGEVSRWKLLNELIGKQDGGKFQQFAQSLIFEQLIAEANRALCRFTDRYELISIEDSPLDFNVIDHYQCDEIRSVRNLSGGESFLVSTALALALPRMSGEQLEIDTLFLDEGFGTLDEETLAHVLSQIQSLQSEGKLVGIITHVPNIEIFVPVRIRLLPAEKSGRSRIVGPGVTAW